MIVATGSHRGVQPPSVLVMCVVLRAAVFLGGKNPGVKNTAMASAASKYQSSPSVRSCCCARTGTAGGGGGAVAATDAGAIVPAAESGPQGAPTLRGCRPIGRCGVVYPTVAVRTRRRVSGATGDTVDVEESRPRIVRKSGLSTEASVAYGVFARERGGGGRHQTTFTLRPYLRYDRPHEPHELRRDGVWEEGRGRRQPPSARRGGIVGFDNEDAALPHVHAAVTTVVEAAHRISPARSERAPAGGIATVPVRYRGACGRGVFEDIYQ